MKLELGFSVGEELSYSIENVYANNMPRCHRHDAYEMYLLLSGERYLFAEGRFYSLRPGDIFLAAPGVLHRTLDSGRGEYSRLTVMIPRHLMPSDCIPSAGIHVARPSDARAAALFAECEELRRLSGTQRAGQGARVLASAMKMLSMLAAEPHGKGFLDVSPQIERVNEILRYIDGHFTEPLSLTQLSSKFFISEYYLCRLFKEHTGSTVLDYITYLRTKRAAELLALGKPVGEVRRASGFGSDSAFGKAFRREYGLSPREWAKRGNMKNSPKM